MHFLCDIFNKNWQNYDYRVRKRRSEPSEPQQQIACKRIFNQMRVNLVRTEAVIQRCIWIFLIFLY